MIERTCLLVKPDGVQKRRVGKVIDRLEQEGFRLVAMKLVPSNPAMMQRFYAEHEGKPFYEPLIEFMTSGALVATIWEGDNVITAVRKIIGSTNSKEAAPGTLRNLYGTDNRKNLVHASDSAASAGREIALLFNANEIDEIPAEKSLY